MSQSFTYLFQNGTTSVELVVGASTTATNSTGFGPGYAVTSVGGTIGSSIVTAESGTGGAVQTDSFGFNYDNTIFASGASGAPQNGVVGSSYGIDYDGIEFRTASAIYNLYYDATQKSFELENLSVKGSTVALTLVTTDAPCYCPGTSILTVNGEVAVEALSIGDRVITASGMAEPIKWIGRRSYTGRLLAGKPHLLPILVRAGALGDGLPHRDLRVSPLHGLLLDGVLVPAGMLVNGGSIVQEPGCQHVDYIHVELARHDIILAEGAPAETFMDDDSRFLFQNAAEYAALYPDLPAAAEFCARRVIDGYELEAIRRRLAQVAETLAAGAFAAAA